MTDAYPDGCVLRGMNNPDDDAYWAEEYPELVPDTEEPTDE